MQQEQAIQDHDITGILPQIQSESNPPTIRKANWRSDRICVYIIPIEESYVCGCNRFTFMRNGTKNVKHVIGYQRIRKENGTEKEVNQGRAVFNGKCWLGVSSPQSIEPIRLLIHPMFFDIFIDSFHRKNCLFHQYDQSLFVTGLVELVEFHHLILSSISHQ